VRPVVATSPRTLKVTCTPTTPARAGGPSSSPRHRGRTIRRGRHARAGWAERERPLLRANAVRGRDPQLRRVAGGQRARDRRPLRGLEREVSTAPQAAQPRRPTTSPRGHATSTSAPTRYRAPDSPNVIPKKKVVPPKARPADLPTSPARVGAQRRPRSSRLSGPDDLRTLSAPAEQTRRPVAEAGRVDPPRRRPRFAARHRPQGRFLGRRAVSLMRPRSSWPLGDPREPPFSNVIDCDLRVPCEGAQVHRRRCAASTRTRWPPGGPQRTRPRITTTGGHPVWWCSSPRTVEPLYDRVGAEPYAVPRRGGPEPAPIALLIDAATW